MTVLKRRSRSPLENMHCAKLFEIASNQARQLRVRRWQVFFKKFGADLRNSPPKMQMVNSAGIYFIRFWNSDLLPQKGEGLDLGVNFLGPNFLRKPRFQGRSTALTAPGALPHWKCHIPRGWIIHIVWDDVIFQH